MATRAVRGFLLAALPLLLLWPGLAAPFLFDDFPTVVENPMVRDPATIVTAWFHHHRAPVYALHAAEHALWGARPAGFRAVNALLHVAAAWLLWGLLRRILPRLLPSADEGARDRIAFWTALLFAVHPLALATAWSVAQRSELLASVFFLASANAAARWAGSGSARAILAAAGLAALSLWSKPAAAGLLLLAAGIAAGRVSSPWKRPAIAGTAAVLAVLLARPFLLLVRETDPTAYWAAQTRVVWDYARIAVLPAGIRLDSDLHAWDVPGAPWGPGLAAIAACAAAAWFLRKGCPDISLAAAWFLAALAPTSLTPLLDVRSDSRAYLATAAFTFLAARLAFSGSGARDPRRGRLLVLAAALFCAGGARLVDQRRSRQAAWIGNAREVPKAARGLANLGEALRESGDFRRACGAYKGALALDASQPLDDARPESRSYAPVLANLGYCLYRTGDIGGAIIAYRKSLESDPGNVDALFNLGTLHAERKEHRIAAAHLEAYLASRPGDPAAVNLLAVSLARSGNADAAAGWWRYLLAFRPDDPRVLNNLGNLHRSAGRTDEAIRHYEVAAGSEPDPEEAAVTLRNLLATRLAADQAEEAEKIRSRLAAIPGADATVPDEPLWR